MTNKDISIDDIEEVYVDEDDVVKVDLSYVPFDRVVEREREARRLKRIFNELKGKERRVVIDLCEELAVLKVHLMETSYHLQRDGILYEMQQGAYSILKSHPAYDIYMRSLRELKATYKQIMDLYPDEATEIKVTNELDELQLFMKRHTK